MWRYRQNPVICLNICSNEVLSAAEAAGVRLMVGHIERYNRAATRLEGVIDSGLLGSIVSMSARRVGPHNPRIRDVRIIMDIGVYDLAAISYPCNVGAESVYAIAGNGSRLSALMGSRISITSAGPWNCTMATGSDRRSGGGGTSRKRT